MRNDGIQNIAVEIERSAPPEVIAEAQRLLALWLLMEYKKRKGWPQPLVN